MVTVTVARLPDNGPPQVGITVDGLDGTQIVDVHTTWDQGRTWHPVRGGAGVPMIGSGFIRDLFPALNLPLRYRATTAEGEVGVSDVVQANDSRMYLQDPLEPRNYATLVSEWPHGPGESVLSWGSHAEASRTQDVEATQVMGASRPVVSVGTRQAAAGVPLIVEQNVAREGGAFARLIARSGQLVIRSHRHRLLDPVAHIVLPDITESLENPGAPDSEQVAVFSGTAMQVRPVNVRLIVPWWTYDDVRAIYAGLTYDDARASRPGATYNDWSADPQGVI